jgi:flagellar biosynthesis protein
VTARSIPLAVALQYEKGGAPRVVAKGRGEIGERIVEIARANGVPLEENAALAAALAEVELEDEIPLELYKAVAEVLLFILKVSGKLR